MVWVMLGMGMLIGGASGVLVILGVAVVHIGQRAWLMTQCGIDWDDAGAILRAKYRKIHRVHQLQGERREILTRIVVPPVMPGGRSVAVLAMSRPHVSGQPPWAGEDTSVDLAQMTRADQADYPTEMLTQHGDIGLV